MRSITSAVSASFPHSALPRSAVAGLAAALMFAIAGTSAAGPAGGATANGASGKFTILHTNDIHGHYTSFHVEPGNATAQTGDPVRSYQEYERSGMIGGFDYLASAIKTVRDQRGRENVLLMDAGDTFGDDLLANLTKGETIIRLMNSVDYDFMALGNHDFDYGLPQTRELGRLARFPMRAANVIDEATGQPLMGDPVKYFHVDGIRIAVLALSYHNTKLTGSRANTEGLQFLDSIETARKYVPGLRENADVVVVVTHEGTRIDREIARQVPGIDFIIGGHSHDAIREPIMVGETRIVQAMSDASALGDLQVTIDKGRISKVDYELKMLWNDEIKPDAPTTALIAEMRAPHEAQLEDRVSTFTDPVGRNYRSDSPIDVLAGEIMMAHTGADIAMLPGLGYGATIYPGELAREGLYRMMPHPATIATVELSGAQVGELLEQSATNNRPTDPMDIVGGLIQTAGIAFTVDYNQPVGERIRDVRVAGKPLQSGARYRVATHSGMMGGLHNYVVLQQGKDIQRSKDRVTDVVESSLRKSGTVGAPAQPSATVIDTPRK